MNFDEILKLKPDLQSLSAKGKTHFAKRLTAPQNNFLESVIIPNLFTECSYICISDIPNVIAKNRATARAYHEGTETDWSKVSYFTNELRTGPEAPKERVHFGENVIFTFESDNIPLPDQIEWTRDLKRPNKGVLQTVFDECSDWSDFSGIVANWSGNKSVHIHLVFKTDQAKSNGIGSNNVRDGLVNHWQRLEGMMRRHCGLLPGQSFDVCLQYPDTLRRLPGGSRFEEMGTPLPHVVLFEGFRTKAKAGATASFWCADLFGARAIEWIGDKARLTDKLSQDQIDYVSAKLASHFDEWPRFHGLDHESGKWIARFHNSDQDQTPSSFMDEDHRTIRVIGQGVGLEPALVKRLPYSLGQMIRQWCVELGAEIQEQPVGNPVEDAFARAARDRQSASVAMVDVFRSIDQRSPTAFLRGPEGIGKSTTLFALHPEIAGTGKPSLYAFGSYDEAFDKCEAFNATMTQMGRTDFIGVCLPSFSRLYEGICQELKRDVFTVIQAASVKQPSLWALVKARQPDVFEAFQLAHAALWNAIGDRTPVFFTVHQVAHQWASVALSRAMWAPSFWRGDRNDKAHQSLCEAETELSLLVHDEVKAESLIDVRSSDEIQWVRQMVGQNRAAWDQQTGSLTGQFQSYLDQCRDAGGLLDFAQARGLARSKPSSWRETSIEYVDGYGPHTDQNHYLKSVGSKWYVLAYEWWKGCSDKVVLLTTENVPTQIMRNVDSDVDIYELRTPLIEKDAIEVVLDRSTVSRNLSEICRSWLDDHAGEQWFCISNKAQGIATASHAKARGSNGFIGENVFQTVAHMSPAQFDRMMAIGNWCGVRDMALMAHIDEINQTAGRNRGFRRKASERHVCQINYTLFDRLACSPQVGDARYLLEIQMDWKQRQNGKR